MRSSSSDCASSCAQQLCQRPEPGVATLSSATMELGSQRLGVLVPHRLDQMHAFGKLSKEEFEKEMRRVEDEVNATSSAIM